MTSRYRRRRRAPQSVARVFADVCRSKDDDYWDYQAFQPIWGAPDDYEVIRKIGRGKYSEVFEGVNVVSGDPIVIKILKPVKKKKNSTGNQNFEEFKGWN